MRSRLAAVLLLIVSSLWFVGTPLAPRAPEAPRIVVTAQPLRFEQNVGQATEGVRYIARRAGMTLALSDGGASLRLRSHGQRETETLTFTVADRRPTQPRGDDRLATRTSYLVGKDPAGWRRDVASFARVTYPGVREGVDLVYHGEQGQLEYDFVVAPGADAASVAMEIGGAQKVALASDGALTIQTRRGALRQLRPRVYQRDARGVEHDVAASYRLVDRTRVGFEVASYDRARELVIDPLIAYSTYLGGSDEDAAYGVATDAAGNAYVTGVAESNDFPGAQAIRNMTIAGADAFVAKLGPTGALLYYTYIGDAAVDDGAFGIALDPSGSVYVTGWTQSAGNFPTTPGAYLTTCASGDSDAFVVKLTAAGNDLVYGTCLGANFTGDIGGSTRNHHAFTHGAGYGITVDATGRAFVTGYAGDAEPSYGTSTPGTAAVAPATISPAAVTTTAVDCSDPSNANNPTCCAATPTLACCAAGTNSFNLSECCSVPGAGEPFFCCQQAVNTGSPDYTCCPSYPDIPECCAHKLALAPNPSDACCDVNSSITECRQPSTCNADPASCCNLGAPPAGGCCAIDPNLVADDPACCALNNATPACCALNPTVACCDVISNAISQCNAATDCLRADPVATATCCAGDLAATTCDDCNGDVACCALHAGAAHCDACAGNVGCCASHPSATGCTTCGTGVYSEACCAAHPSATDCPVECSGDAACCAANPVYGIDCCNQLHRVAFLAEVSANGTAAALSLVTSGDRDFEGQEVVLDTAGGTAYVAGTAGTVGLGSCGGASTGTATDLDGFLASVPIKATVTSTPLGGTAPAGLHYTYIGGSGSDEAQGLAVDANDKLYVVGTTSSTDGTFAGKAPAGGSDAFLVELASSAIAAHQNTQATGLALVSTFGSTGGKDEATAVTVGSTGLVDVVGQTFDPISYPRSAGYPAPPAIHGADAFATRFDADGVTKVLSVTLGGSGDDGATSVARMPTTGIFVAGLTESSDFPVANAAQGTNASTRTAFLVRVAPPAPLSILPTDVNAPPGGTVNFTAAGGFEGTYAFSLPNGPSGGAVATLTGVYTAGAAGNVVDTVRVTDASGATADALVHVGAPLTLTPAQATVAPHGAVLFTATGGLAPYTFGLTSNASGGTVSNAGNYVAGGKGGVHDVIRVTDAAGATTTALVVVTDALTITPDLAAVPPHGKVAFTAAGGSGTGYTWSIATNASGGSIIPGTGAYTAGNGSHVVDVVAVTDSLGNTAQVNVSVGGGLAVSPAAPSVVPHGTVAFVAVGGSNVYTWSITTNASGGTIAANSGAYVAGATGSVNDVVQVTDSVGNHASITVTVGPALSLTPATAAVASGGHVSFAAAGGSGTYTFAITPNASGGSIQPDGAYTAGTHAPAQDVVVLSDSLGATASATVAVSGGTASVDAGVPTGTDADGGALPTTPPSSSDSCSCRLPGGSSSPTSGGVASLAALGLATALLRRRRSR